MMYMLFIKIFTTIKIKEQIEDEFNRALEHTEPLNRPLLPKQQNSKKFFASGALTIIRLNGNID
jgi:hypothetical protein